MRPLSSTRVFSSINEESGYFFEADYSLIKIPHDYSQLLESCPEKPSNLACALIGITEVYTFNASLLKYL
jgi:hypothetical protein